MNSYIIGLKLIGIYFIISGVSLLPSFLMTLEDMEMVFSLSFQLLSPLLMFLSGLFVFFKTKTIVNISFKNNEKESLTSLTFSNAVQLLGVFLFASSIGALISNSFALLFSEQGEYQAFRYEIYLYQHLVTVFLGLALVVKGKKLVDYIKETT